MSDVWHYLIKSYSLVGHLEKLLWISSLIMLYYACVQLLIYSFVLYFYKSVVMWILDVVDLSNKDRASSSMSTFTPYSPQAFQHWNMVCNSVHQHLQCAVQYNKISNVYAERIRLYDFVIMKSIYVTDCKLVFTSLFRFNLHYLH